jgi:hypothetical protein
MVMNPPQAEAARRRKLRRNWTCSFKVELVRTMIRAAMWRARFPKTDKLLALADEVIE